MAKKIEADGGGLRYNEHKNALELIPPLWVWGLGEVMTRGAHKYATRNWERGMKWSTCVGCALRHIFKFCMGSKYDDGPKGTGCHHMFMAAWNLLVLADYDIRGIGENDLPEYDVKWLEKVANIPMEEYVARVEADKAANAKRNKRNERKKS